MIRVDASVSRDEACVTAKEKIGHDSEKETCAAKVQKKEVRKTNSSTASGSLGVGKLAVTNVSEDTGPPRTDNTLVVSSFSTMVPLKVGDN